MIKSGGIILCGGESRRMGRSKAWLRFGPEFMLQRVARLLGEVASPIVVVAAPGQDLPELPETIEIVRDPVSGRGPLQGLAAGLAAFPDAVELVYATATDAPFLRPSWVARLAELIGDRDVAIPEIGGFLHPLAALYRRRPTSLAIEPLIEEGNLRLVSLVDKLSAVRVGAESMTSIDSELATLRNLNTLEEYREALGEAGFGSG